MMTTMQPQSPSNSPKQQMMDILQEQPDDSSHEELLRELALNRMIARGLTDIAENRLISDEELSRKVKTWQHN